MIGRPCGSCPYRQDVPSGVWHPDEYVKLPAFDGPTGEQTAKAFFCHQQDGNLCAGWVGCHDMHESLGLRIALLAGMIDQATFEAALIYESPVPLWGSGAEAAEHGLAQVREPGETAKRTIAKLERRASRR